jgi:hypothetical protein
MGYDALNSEALNMLFLTLSPPLPYLQPDLQFFDLVTLLPPEFRSQCISSSICSDAIPRIESTTINVDVHLPSLIASHDFDLSELSCRRACHLGAAEASR